jgi:hypothetical protein
MLSYSPWEGGDLVFSVVNGRGLDEAGEDRKYDRDNNKPVSLRYSQELVPVRIGGFGYVALERNSGFADRITVWGPDVTLTHGAADTAESRSARGYRCSPAEPRHPVGGYWSRPADEGTGRVRRTPFGSGVAD